MRNPLTPITNLFALGRPPMQKNQSEDISQPQTPPKTHCFIYRYRHLHQPPQLKPIPEIQSRRATKAPPSALRLSTLQRLRDPECNAA